METHALSLSGNFTQLQNFHWYVPEIREFIADEVFPIGQSGYTYGYRSDVEGYRDYTIDMETKADNGIFMIGCD